MTDWGTGPDGRLRKPCPDIPAAVDWWTCLTCGVTYCGEHGAPWLDYESIMQRPWPPGYEQPVVICACGQPQEHLRALIEHYQKEHTDNGTTDSEVRTL